MSNLVDDRAIAEKRDKEARVLTTMVELYCRFHHRGSTPCSDCADLIDYSLARIRACPREYEKTFCSSCPHPCYQPAMRERIRKVMRWSGPRMIFFHPVLAMRHLHDRRTG
ncbi:MAG: nitrous oxide-stimulated promoter family protein [Eggerthellaceae bacterium]|jgi:hypothetical protein